MPRSSSCHRSPRRHLAALMLAALTLVGIASQPSQAVSPEKKDDGTQSAQRSPEKQIQSAQTAKSKTAKPATPVKQPEMTMDKFLDRLMIAESGGNNTARNPLSTATGPFQFIESTFLSVMRRHFPKRVENLSASQILALRTKRAFARGAAKAYTRDNATYLVAAGHKPTFPHLRLAFLLGAGGAIRILDAKPETRLAGLVGRGVIRANPWMARHTARSLIARAAREVSLSPTTLAGAKPFRDPVTGKLIMPSGRRARGPRIRVRCNLARPSCKRWLSLQRRKLSRRKSKKGRNRVAGAAKR